MNISGDPQVWVIAIGTLMIYSYLWKENAAYRLMEHMLLGLGIAFSAVLTWDTLIIPRVRTNIIAQGHWMFVVFGLLGLLLYTRMLSPKWSWLSRYPVAVSVGYGVGFSMAMSPRPWLLQVRDSFRDLWVVRDGVFRAQATFDEWVFFIALITTVMYFFFTVPHRVTAVRVGSRIGRYAIMVAFGAAFGNTVAGRISLFLGRLQFLLHDWLGFII
ncbi:MAG TPA: hypothetical protein DCM14_04485 [Clostridiales bacterium UBA8153]|nr:hypothetical protein [Clostridiales bacterium UBA8153]